MTGILLATHGNLSEVLLNTASMFFSEIEGVKTVSFLPGQGVEDLEVAIREALEAFPSNEGVLALVDLPGGSPARVVSQFVLERTNMELLTGVNIPMLVEILLLRSDHSLQDLAQIAKKAGTEGIVNLSEVLRTEINNL